MVISTLQTSLDLLVIIDHNENRAKGQYGVISFVERKVSDISSVDLESRRFFR